MPIGPQGLKTQLQPNEHASLHTYRSIGNDGTGTSFEHSPF